MEDYSAMIRSTFEMGSVRDAETLFETCIKNAFPTNLFRRLELIRFVREDYYMEGRSWNHVFEIRKGSRKGSPVWEVQCRRVPTMPTACGQSGRRKKSSISMSIMADN